jgi:tetratricopeptide (TPR) repeat protein
MGNLCRPLCGLRNWAILLAACGSLAAVAEAACSGPAAMAASLQVHPTTENAIQLGNWYAEHDQFACAAETFRAALKADPTSAQLYYLEGLALAGSGDAASAFEDIQRASVLDPQQIKPHLVLATILDKDGKHAQAEDQWRLALQIDPGEVPALEGLSRDLLGREDYAGVIVLLRNAPRTETLSIDLSQALGKMNYLSDALKVLTEAMQQSPQSLDLPKAMTVVLVNMHRYEDAIKLVQTTADQHPDDIDSQVELFRILVLTNHFDRARPLADRLLPLRPHDPTVLYLCGMLSRAVGDTAKARAQLEESVQLQPNFFYSRYNLGIVLVILREWQEAKVNLEKAVDLGVPLAEVHYELAKALKGLGETDAARKEMALFQDLKAADETALEADTAAARGDQALADGKTDEAIQHYKDATDQTPNNASYKFRLSIALRKAGDLPGERAQLEAAVKLDPAIAGAQIRLGVLMAREGDADGAAAHFRLATAAAPTWPEAWINLAAELAVGAHFGEAQDAVGKALVLDPNNAQAQALKDRLAQDPRAQDPRAQGLPGQPPQAHP